MRIIRCDRCGKDIPPDVKRIGYVSFLWREVKTDDLDEENPYAALDFCPECMDEIQRCIEKITEPKQVAVPPPKRERIDRGKVKALKDAGWTNAAIAAEIRCTEERVRQILKEDDET